MKKIGVLVSGGGTNLQALIDNEKKGLIDGKIVTVVSSKNKVYALERAKKHKIPYKVIERKKYNSLNDYDEAILKHMQEYKVDLIVMAGFLSIIGNKLIKEYPNKIINIHPSLIPSFCGKGFYGMKVHEEVLKRGVKVTGASVHFVNEVPDGGPIILQKCVPVKEDDTPEILQLRVMEESEWTILPRAVSLFCDNRLQVVGNRVLISEK